MSEAGTAAAAVSEADTAAAAVSEDGAGTVAAAVSEEGAGTVAAAVSEVGAGSVAVAVSEVGTGSAAAAVSERAGTADRQEVWGGIAVGECLKVGIAETEGPRSGADIPLPEWIGGGAGTLADEDVGLVTAGTAVAEG